MTANATTLNGENGSIKKMIRDTTRLLNRPNLPADMRREQERKLAALQVALTDRQKGEVEREMAVKYRMVKFFERKKALRRLATAQASGNSGAVAEAQLDLAYILHFPKDRKYISLYPAGAEVLAERDAIRKQISEKLAVLGAEVLLAKAMGSKKVKAALKDSDDDEEESDEDDSEGSEDDDESGSEDGSDSEGSDDSDDDSEDELSYDEDSDDLGSDDEDGDSDDDDEDDSDDDSDEDGSDDDEDDDSDLDGSDDSNESQDSDDEDSDDSDDEEDSDEEEEDSDSDEEAPKTKKLRR